MKIPVALYPFSLELLPAIKFFNVLQNKFILKKVIAPSGYALTGKDVGVIANHPKVGITVTDEIDEKSSEWSMLIVVKNDSISKTLRNQEAEKINKVLASNKEVLYITDTYDEVYDEILELTKIYGEKIKILVSDNNCVVENPLFLSEEISTPVILVGGLFKQADVSEVVYKLSAYLKKENIVTATYVNNPIGTIFGFHSIYPILKQNEFSEEKKISLMHLIFQKIEQEKKPDIIIVEAPDAIMKYSENIPNGYGILTYMLKQSVNYDYLICCIPFELIDGKYLEVVSKGLEESLGRKIDAVHASNVILDVTETIEKKEISLVHVSTEKVKKYLRKKGNVSIPVFDLINQDVDELFKNLSDM